MEPRPHERGKRNDSGGSRRCPVGFNGATSSRTWKAAAAAWRVSSAICFNGATSSRTWKVAGVIAERLSTAASMEPRPHERGKDEAAVALLQRARRFNGATSSRTWKGMAQASFRLRLLASMEPRPHERGKIFQKRSGFDHGQASMEPRPHERGKS